MSMRNDHRRIIFAVVVVVVPRVTPAGGAAAVAMRLLITNRLRCLVRKRVSFISVLCVFDRSSSVPIQGRSATAAAATAAAATTRTTTTTTMATTIKPSNFLASFMASH